MTIKSLTKKINGKLSKKWIEIHGYFKEVSTNGFMMIGVTKKTNKTVFINFTGGYHIAN